ncbi:hypothetical protein V8F20_012105 [Naviculisporaceae sp. PSN 640]
MHKMASSDTSSSANGRDSEPIIIAPGPWKTRATSIIIPLWTSSATASNLPAKAYHPLEATSPFASTACGKPLTSMGFIQLVRYHDTPAGTYDEMVLIPGLFTYPTETADGKKKDKTARRITRIYVSQKHTAWNGRRNWNIPKHLASFSWTESSPSPGIIITKIKVYPHDTTVPYDPSESTPSTVPFFQCTLQTVKYIPSFPFRSTWLRPFGYGLDMTLVQPPVPDATSKTNEGELAGSAAYKPDNPNDNANTNGQNGGEGNDGRWVMVDDFYQASDKTSLVWVDMRQHEQIETQRSAEDAEKDEENFWPGMGKWIIGVKLEDGVIELGAGKTWPTPRAVL